MEKKNNLSNFLKNEASSKHEITLKLLSGFNILEDYCWNSEIEAVGPFFQKIINLTSFVKHESKLQYMFIAIDNFGVKHSFANFSLFFQKVIKKYI